MRKADGTEALHRARTLRRAQTPAEVLLWQHLRDRRLSGLKFRRQEWVGPYIADFYCWRAKLIVELDGSHHAEQVEETYDAARTRFLKSRGFRVIRFWNNQVTEELEGVLATILHIATSRLPSPSRPASRARPLPLPERERGNGSLALPGRGKGPAPKAWEG